MPITPSIIWTAPLTKKSFPPAMNCLKRCVRFLAFSQRIFPTYQKNLTRLYRLACPLDSIHAASQTKTDPKGSVLQLCDGCRSLMMYRAGINGRQHTLGDSQFSCSVVLLNIGRCLFCSGLS